jgi:hypothetical protein
LVNALVRERAADDGRRLKTSAIPACARDGAAGTRLVYVYGVSQRDNRRGKRNADER